MATDLISEERFLYTKANQIGKTKDEIEYSEATSIKPELT